MSRPDLTFPTVKLTLTPVSGSSDLDITTWIQNLSWNESNDSLNMLSVTLAVPESDKIGPKDQWTTDDFRNQAFMPGGAFKLEFYDHAIKKASTTADVERTGDIVTVKHGLSASGRRTVTLTGLETLHRLKGLNLNAMSNDENVLDLAGVLEAALEDIKASGVASGSTYTDKTPIILDQSKLGLVKQIADNLGKVIVYDSVDEKMTLADPGTNADAKITVTWGFDIKTINMTLDIADQATKVVVTGLKDDKGEDVTHEIEKAQVERQKGITGTGLRKDAFGEYTVNMLPWSQDLPVGFVGDPADAEVKASAVFQNMSDRFVRGSISCSGQPTAAQNGTVTVESAPWPFAGSFIIDSVSHNYSPEEGLATELSFFSNAVLEPE